MLYSIGDVTFNLTNVLTVRKVYEDMQVGSTTKFIFFIVKLDNGDELHCAKDSPTYEEFIECWEQVIPRFKSKHNVSHQLPTTTALGSLVSETKEELEEAKQFSKQLDSILGKKK